VWWKSPQEALADRFHFVRQMMQLGTSEDVARARILLGDAIFIQALARAPAGALDAKSWNFWHLFFSLRVPPLPERSLPL